MRYVNAADARYAPTPERPSRLHNAWTDVEPGGEFFTPYEAIGAWKLPTDEPLVVDKPGVWIHGEGRTQEDLGWVAHSRNGSVLKIAAPNVRVSDLCISRWFWHEDEPNRIGSGCGVLCDNASPIWGLTLERVGVLYMGADCIQFAGTGEAGYQVSPVLRDVHLFGAGARGFYARLTNAAECPNLTVHACQTGPAFVMEDCAGGRFLTATEGNAGDYQMILRRCNAMEVRGWWEDHAARRAVLMEGCTGSRLGGCFGGWQGIGSVRLGSGTRRCVITASAHYGSPVAVEDGGDATVIGNVIEPQEGAPVRVNARRNRVL